MREMTPLPPLDPAGDVGDVRLRERKQVGAGDVIVIDVNKEVTGIVEIYYDDGTDAEWRSVCDDYWSYKAAKVVCRQLGYTGVERETVAAPTGLPFGPDDSDEDRWYWLDNVDCNGNEDALLECPLLEDIAYRGRIIAGHPSGPG